jgi:hypothetical protein
VDCWSHGDGGALRRACVALNMAQFDWSSFPNHPWLSNREKVIVIVLFDARGAAVVTALVNVGFC